ncbi:MAG: DUF6458 family protein [Microbacteriaceae bacterium]
MSIGSGITLFVVGAVLAFAINIDTGGVVNLDLIGYLLMAAGFITFVIGLSFAVRKRQSVTTVRTAGSGTTGESVQERSTSTSGDTVI